MSSMKQKNQKKPIQQIHYTYVSRTRTSLKRPYLLSSTSHALSVDSSLCTTTKDVGELPILGIILYMFRVCFVKWKCTVRKYGFFCIVKKNVCACVIKMIIIKMIKRSEQLYYIWAKCHCYDVDCSAFLELRIPLQAKKDIHT